MPFACFQLEGESLHAAVYAFAKAAAELGLTFKRLEVLGPWELGPSKFVRFRTSCNRAHIKAVADKLGRECVVPGPEGTYEVFLHRVVGPRPISAAAMQAVALPGFKRMYRGPGEPFWERQFGEK